MALIYCIKNKFISTIIGTLGIFISLSFLLSFSNFSVYITSYIHIKQEFVTMHYGIFMGVIFGLANSFSKPLGGCLESVIGFNGTIYLGIGIVSISNLLFIIQQNIWICYSLLVFLGTGFGLSMSLIVKNLTFYHPNKKGIIYGFMGDISLLINLGFTIIGEKIISWEGYTLQSNEDLYPEKIAKRVYLYYTLGEICIPIGLLITIFFINEYKYGYGKGDLSLIQDIKKGSSNLLSESEINIEEHEEEIDESMMKSEEKDDVLSKYNGNKLTKEQIKKNVKQVIKTCRYWVLVINLMFFNFSISYIINTGKTFGAIIGIDGTSLQFANTFSVGLLIIFSPILGIVNDKIGALIPLRILSIIGIFPGLILKFFMKKTFAFIIGFKLCSVLQTSLVLCLNSFLMEVYGIQETVTIGGILLIFIKMSEIFSTISGFILSKIYKNEELEGPYSIMYIICSIFSFLSFILSFFESNKKFVYQSNEDESKDY